MLNSLTSKDCPIDSNIATVLFNLPLQQLQHKLPIIYKSIFNQTSYLSPSIKRTKQRLWHIVHNKHNVITCKHCDNLVKWKHRKNNGYQLFCSAKCAGRDDDVKSKRVDTVTKKYGKKNVSQIPDIQHKRTNTFMEKYGVDNISKNHEIQRKKQETSLLHWGTSQPLASSDVRDKIYKTNTQKYGHANYINSNNFKKKSESTNLKKYGNVNFNQSLLQHGVLHHLNDKDWLQRQYKKMSTVSIAKLLNVTSKTVCTYFRKHNIPIRYDFYVSSEEQEIVHFLTSLGISDICTSDRTVIPPYELDIYIPSERIAIELNGIYWHSEEQGKHKWYHLNKTQRCEKNNIQLLHFWDIEWHNRSDIIKSMLRYKFNKLQNKHNARDCDVVVLDSKTKRKFVNNNHIKGDARSSINIGLVNKNTRQLLQVMTFMTHRYSSKYEYEIIRLCSLCNNIVRGGSSKLWSFFVNQYHPNSVSTYADLAYGTGQIYETLGFEPDNQTLPGYSYVKGNQLYSRLQFQKHTLSNKLDIFDKNKTEKINMRNNDYLRVWDCGHNKYVWRS